MVKKIKKILSIGREAVEEKVGKDRRRSDADHKQRGTKVEKENKTRGAIYNIGGEKQRWEKLVGTWEGVTQAKRSTSGKSWWAQEKELLRTWTQISRGRKSCYSQQEWYTIRGKTGTTGKTWEAQEKELSRTWVKIGRGGKSWYSQQEWYTTQAKNGRGGKSW